MAIVEITDKFVSVRARRVTPSFCGAMSATLAFQAPNGDVLPGGISRLVSIKDTSGAKDGAGAIVKVYTASRFGVRKDTIRIKESPSEIQAAFKEADIKMPRASVSIGCLTRKAASALGFGPK